MPPRVHAGDPTAPSASRILAGAPAPDRRLELAADGMMSVAEAVAFLGLSDTAVYALMDRGEVAFAKCGRRRLVSRRSVTEFLAARMSGG
jgi:excisionase family DNA binding protein